MNADSDTVLSAGYLEAQCRGRNVLQDWREDSRRLLCRLLVLAGKGLDEKRWWSKWSEISVDDDIFSGRMGLFDGTSDKERYIPLLRDVGIEA